MDPNPKSSKNKIAFTGTNCSGKTTMALEVTTRLKSEHHYLAEVVSSQDRKVNWKDDHFPVDPRAHYGMMTNLIHAEVQAELKGDADVVITDRSVLDLYAIALVDHPNSKMILNMRGMIDSWLETYTKIFYLPPLDYQEDGKRPPNDFRMKTHASLLREIESRNYSNVEMISDRSTVMSKVRNTLGLTSPNPPILAAEEKLQFLATVMQVRLFVKSRKWASSDLDVWVIPCHATNFSRDILEKAQTLFDVVVGSSVTVSLMFMPPDGLPVLEAQHPDSVLFTPGPRG